MATKALGRARAFAGGKGQLGRFGVFCGAPERQDVAEGRRSAEVVVPLPYSRRVFASSWLVAITAGLAALHGQFLCSALCLLVLLGTVNYWRDPRSGWRRRCDFLFANSGIGYHLLLALVLWTKTPLRQKLALLSPSVRPWLPCGPAWPALNPLGFWLLWGCALVLYLRARACAQEGQFDAGTRWHVGFHCVGNLANILLYPALPR
ncbi:unnamed protein product [Effrenium voratum]|nr:unnamed protein product [Effrenium voratum]